MIGLSGITTRSVLTGAQQLDVFRTQGSALTALEGYQRKGMETRPKDVGTRIAEVRGEIVADSVQTTRRILQDNSAALREMRGQTSALRENNTQTKFPPDYNPAEAYQQKIQQELLKQPQFPPEYDPVKEQHAELQRELLKQPEFPPEYPPEYDPVEEFLKEPEFPPEYDPAEELRKRQEAELDPLYGEFQGLPRMEDEKFPVVFYGVQPGEGKQNVIILAFQPEPQVNIAV